MIKLFIVVLFIDIHAAQKMLYYVNVHLIKLIATPPPQCCCKRKNTAELLMNRENMSASIIIIYHIVNYLTIYDEYTLF